MTGPCMLGPDRVHRVFFELARPRVRGSTLVERALAAPARAGGTREAGTRHPAAPPTPHAHRVERTVEAESAVPNSEKLTEVQRDHIRFQSHLRVI